MMSIGKLRVASRVRNTPCRAKIQACEACVMAQIRHRAFRETHRSTASASLADDAVLAAVPVDVIDDATCGRDFTVRA